MARFSGAPAVLAVALLGLAACASPVPGQSPPIVKTAPADTFRVDDSALGLPEASTELGDDAYVVMPHVIVEAGESAVVTEVTPEVASSYGFTGQLRSAEGHELVIASIAASTGPAGSGSATVGLLAGSATFDLTEALAEADELAVLVSVEQDAPVQVRVEDEGREVGLDIRSGERVDVGETAGYYGPGISTTISGELTVSVTIGVDNPAYEAWIPTGVTTVSLMAENAEVWRHEWVDGPGWADDGEDYLLFSGLAVEYELAETSCKAVMPADSAFTLVPAEAETRAELEIDGEVWLMRTGSPLVFAVPHETTQVTLRFDPDWHPSEGCALSEESGAAELEVTLGSS